MIKETIKQLDLSTLKSSFSSVRWSYNGRVTEVTGNLIEAILPETRLGDICQINIPHQQNNVLAETIGFRGDKVLLMAYSDLQGVFPGCKVEQCHNMDNIPVGDFLLGKVLDPFLTPLTGGDLQAPENCLHHSINRESPNPLERCRISSTLSLGVRAIDSMLTFGEGQRVGIMAGSGVGKSVLMGMIAKNCTADVNVIALIGERGREVREFIEKELGEDGLKRSVVICSTSDQSPLIKIRAAKTAMSIAEYFSDTGKSVMLMADSITRVAMAQREIGNMIGEPPSTKGYTPSVFSLLPRLLERAGPQKSGKGPISALYTVLVDGDDFNDPIADCVRSIVDGHICLTRDLAAKGHFPAVDITTSTSRVMHDVVSKEHWKLAQHFRELIGVYKDNQDLIQIGAYQSGTNYKLDEAISLINKINSFLKQDMFEASDLESAIEGMQRVLRGESHAGNIDLTPINEFEG